MVKSIVAFFKDGNLRKGASRDVWIWLSLLGAGGYSLRLVEAYHPVLDFHHALDDLLRFLLLLVLGGAGMVWLQQRFRWGNLHALIMLLYCVLFLLVLLKPQWAYWSEIIKILSPVVLVMFSSWGLGLGMLRLLGLRPNEQSGFDLLAFAAGAGLLSLLIFGLGVVHQLTPSHLMALVATLGFAMLPLTILPRVIPKNRSSSLHAPALAPSERPVSPPWSWLDWIAVIALIRIIFTLLASHRGQGALNPIIEFDAVMYRMTVPKAWLSQGNLDFLLPIRGSFSPAFLETFFAVGLAFETENAAKMMHLLFSLASVAACFILGQEWGGRRTGMLAALLYLLIPEFQYFARFAYVDGVGGGYLVWGTLCGWKFWQTRRWQWLFLCGWMGGVLAAFRLQGLLLALILGSVLALGLLWERREDWRKILRWAGLFGGAVSLAGAGWYVHHWWALGNPVYPFAYEWLGGHYFDWEAQDVAAFTGQTIHYGYPKTFWNFILSPLRFYEDLSRLDTKDYRSLGVIPLLGSVGLLWGFQTAATRWASLILLAGWASWFWGAQIARYALPLFSLSAALGAWLVAQLSTTRQRQAASALLFLLMLSVNKETLSPPAFPRLLAPEKETWLQEEVDNYTLTRYLQKHASPQDLVYTFYDSLWYYYPTRFLGDLFGASRYAHLWTEEKKLPLEFKPPEVLQVFFCRWGVDYLTVNVRDALWPDFARGSPDPLTNLHQAEYQDLLELVVRDRYMFLYKVHPRCESSLTP